MLTLNPQKDYWNTTKGKLTNQFVKKMTKAFEMTVKQGYKSNSVFALVRNVDHSPFKSKVWPLELTVCPRLPLRPSFYLFRQFDENALK